MKMIKLTVSMLCCLFVLGCASGRYPEPVLSYQPGDGCMSCEELRVEMAKVKREMMVIPTKIQERDNRNSELFGAGLFLWYPWGERDNFKAYEVEINALNTRYNNLFMIAVNKGCPLGNNTITVKKSGGRDITLNDVLKDELPPRVEPLASLSQ
jgi:hypothetical protein